MKRWRSRKSFQLFQGVRGALSLGLALGAVMGSKALGMSCEDTPEAFVSLQIGSLARGNTFARLGEQAWVNADLLTPAEQQGYVAGRVDCGGDHYLQLRPDVRWNFDPELQRLTIEPQPALLGRHIFDLSLPADAAPADLNIWRLDYLASLSAQPGGLSQFVSVRPSIASRHWKLTGEVSESGASRSTDSPAAGLTVAGRADVLYQWNENLSVQGVLNGESKVYGQSQFSGVQFHLGREVPLSWPALNLELPFDATLSVTSTGGYRSELQAPAGLVKLLNIPVTGGSGLITVMVKDAQGVRTITQPYLSQSRGFTAGSFQLTAEAGTVAKPQERGDTTTRIPYGGTQFVWGVRPHLALMGKGLVSSQGGAFDLNAFTTGGAIDAELGIQGGWGVSAPDLALRGSLGWIQGPLALKFAMQLPDFQLDQGLYTAQFIYAKGPFELAGGLSYAAVSGVWQPQISGAWQLSESTRVSLAVERTEKRTNGKLQLLWQPNPKATLRLEASPKPNAYAKVALNGQSSVEVWAQPGLTGQVPQLSAIYQQRGATDLLIQANSSRSVYASVAGAIVSIGGPVFAVRPKEGALLLVRTGQPGILVRIRGVGEQRTNAQGDVMFADLQIGGDYSAEVDLTELPIELTVQEQRHAVHMGRSALSVLDWRGNFEMNDWVSFRWSNGEPARLGMAQFANQQFLLDSEGTALIPVRYHNQTGTLTLGQQQCSLLWPTGKTEVQCSPLP